MAPSSRSPSCPADAGDPQWTPDGKALVVSSSTPQDQAAARLTAAKLGRATGDDAHVSDVKVITRSNFRSNGVGLLDPSNVSQLYMIYLPKSDGTQDPAWQLTSGRYSAGEPILSENGWLFFSSLHLDEPIYEEFPHTTLYGFKLTTGAHGKDVPAVTFTHDMGLGARGIALSPDGKHLAFGASGEQKTPATHRQTDLWVVDMNWSGDTPSITGAPRNLTGALAYEMGGRRRRQHRSARRRAWRHQLDCGLDPPDRCCSGSRLSAAGVGRHRTGQGHRADAEEAGCRSASSARADGSKTIALISNPILIGDLFTIGPNQTADADHPLNDKLFSQLDIAMPLDIQVKPTHHAADIKGETIDTFIMLPPGVLAQASPHRRLPLDPQHPRRPALRLRLGLRPRDAVHGRARATSSIYPNPRGSTTYGENFANIIMNNYPGDDFHDLMDTVDDAVKLGYADPNKPRRHRRLRRRPAHRLGRHPDQPLQSRGRAARHHRLGRLVVHGGHRAASTSRSIPKAPPFENVEALRRALAHHLRRTTSRRR